MREDITELKNALRTDLPALQARVAVLETEAKLWKARVGTATAIATLFGGMAAWLCEHIIFK